MTHKKQFWEDCLPVGGTHIAAGQAGVLLVKIKTTLEKFTKNCLLWEGPHGTAENRIPFPKRTEERFLEITN